MYDEPLTLPYWRVISPESASVIVAVLPTLLPYSGTPLSLRVRLLGSFCW